MKPKSLVVLAAIALVVVALGVYRSRTAPAAAGQAEKAAEPGHGLPGILDFGRGECLPCKQMFPVLDELAEKHKGKIVVRYLDLNVPENLERANAMRVRVIPTQVFIDAEGEEVIRHEGFWSLEDIEFEMEVLEWISER